MSYGLSYMKTVSVFYILMGALFVSNGLLRGAGDMGAFMLSSVVNLFSRVVIAYLLAHFIAPAPYGGPYPRDGLSAHCSPSCA